MNKVPDLSAADPNGIPLGYWPAINAYYHRYFNQSSLLIQTFVGSGAIDAAALDVSLQATSARHPLLNCHLVESEHSIELRTVADNSRHIESLWVDELDSFAIAKQLLAAGIGDEMWRVILVKSASAPDAWLLLMVCHHAIGDGLSMTAFFDQLLRHYAGDEPQSNSVFALPVLPETLGGIEISNANPDTTIAEWSIDEFAALENRQVGLLQVPLAIDNLDGLLEACQRERVSLTNLITAALLRACGFDERAKVATAVDIRKRVKPVVGPEHFGCYAGVVESSVPWAEDIWQHARLSSVYQFRGKNRLLMPVPQGPILRQMMKLRIDSALGAGFCAGGCAVSDVGELAVQQHYGTLTINEIHLANRQLAGLYGVFLTAARFAGKLSLNMSFAEPLLSVERAEKLGQGIADQLQGSIA